MLPPERSRSKSDAGPKGETMKSDERHEKVKKIKIWYIDGSVRTTIFGPQETTTTKVVKPKEQK